MDELESKFEKSPGGRISLNNLINKWNAIDQSVNFHDQSNMKSVIKYQ